VPPASLSSSIIDTYCAPLVSSYNNLTRASSSSSIICAYCAPLVLSYKQHRFVLLYLSDISDMRHDGYPIQIIDSTLSNSSTLSNFSVPLYIYTNPNISHRVMNLLVNHLDQPTEPEARVSDQSNPARPCESTISAQAEASP
jgi:hypothetical protein